MPEGAEVKLVGESLAQMVGIRRCLSIQPISGRYCKKPITGIEMFEPTKVVGVGVKGKLIFWILENDQFLLNTLGMTGHWTLDSSNKHNRVKFNFDSGAPVFFSDIRNFGTLKVIRTKKAFLDKLNSLGPDMLSEDVSSERFNAALDVKQHWTVTKAIMDQSVICGVGNYVKAEALYRARLSPHRLVGSLSTEDMKNLKEAIENVLKESYERQGASIRNYRAPEGDAKAADFFQVYGRKTDPYGHEVVKEDAGDGRSTHWVPQIQR